MLKINNCEYEIGTSFQIRNSWRKKICENLNRNEENYPFNFKISGVSDGAYKTLFYICESIPDTKNDIVEKIVVAKSVLQYLLADEVPNSNVGLYFTDYLPLENSKLLVVDKNNFLNITPMQFVLKVGHYGDEKKSNIVYLNFELVDILNPIKSHYISTQGKNPWKLLDGEDTYMTDAEKMYQDTFIHKGYVLKICDIFATYLENEGLKEDAVKLRERAIVHDNSKILNKDEFRALTGIINDKSCLKDASSQLSMFKQDSIELHWKHNSHHPEHFENILDMTRIDRFEMICDWGARALQYNSNLLEFVEKRQKERFHFPELVYEEIYHYCKVLVELLEKDNKQ